MAPAGNVASCAFHVAGRDDLRVVRFFGSEGISELFRFRVELAAEDDGVSFDAIVAQSCTLSVEGATETRTLSGIVGRFEQTGSAGRFTLYRAEIVPKIWLLSHRQKCRIFQKHVVSDMSVKGIVTQVLTDAGLADGDDFRFGLTKTYETRDYCVQYRESDLDFVCRLLEEEGIFYHFEHSEDGHLLRFSDAPSAFGAIAGDPAVAFRDEAGEVTSVEHVFRFRYAEEVRPGAVVLRDYEYLKPSLSLEAESTYEKDTSLEVYDYPGEYLTPEEGSHLAEVRLQELQSTRKAGAGASDCVRMTPGFTFSLQDHPRSDFNAEYVLTRVHHEAEETEALEELSGGAASSYANEFECIPSDVPFRPARSTPRPIVRGSQTAVVVGPSGDEIYTDAHGRIKVQFHWDRDGAKDEKSSCWIRVSQVWAGVGWGAMHIPRIGQEVIVDFLEGDPDRPIVTGRVYNGENVVPYALESNKTQSGIKSRSSKEGGEENFNEIRFEDSKGEEQLFIHAEKNQDIEVENDETHWVGHDRTKTVDNDETTEVKHDRAETVGNDETISIGHNRTETVKNDESVSIGNNRTKTVEKDETVSIGNNRTEDVTKEESITIGTNRTTSVGENETLNVTKNRTVDVKEEEALTVGKNRTVETKESDTLKVGKALTIGVEKQIEIKTGDASIIMKSDGTIEIKGVDIKITGTGKIEVKADSSLTLKGSEVKEN